MKTVVGVIAALVTVGIAALGLLTAQQLSSPPDHVAGPTSAPAAPPSRVMTPWPERPTTSVPTAAPVASAPAEPASSATPPVASEQASPSNADSRLTGVTTTDSPEASGARSNIAPCEKPDAMGVSRVVEIDTTGGPEFGLQHLRGYDFLRDKEVVLTFDDRPRPVSTAAVVKALQDECLKATLKSASPRAARTHLRNA